ncbi:MAG TPA: cytosine permease, partial [Clostridiaceae bacterium]|nr:cytosine permease [Clostridiaceae bacterium]
MENRKTTTLSNSLLWFGASVSIAEIFTGTLIAPLGFRRGLLAIVIGHAVGCFLLYLAGLIGARSGKSAMETVGFSFGSRGRILFAGLNVLQLVGWTAVMIIGGARAMTIILGSALGFKGELLFCLVIGGLILLWVLMGITNLGKVNVFAVTGLLLLSVLLSFVVFNGGIPVFTGGTMSFGMALELSIAMPRSWLPLISDYTK